MPRVLITAAALVVTALAAPAPAGATVNLTAYRTRIGDHPAFVRVVVDFTDGTINAPTVMASDPDPYPDGRVRVAVPGTNAQAQAPPIRREGVRARVLPGHDRVVVAVSAASRRFKYAGYQVLHEPERLVIDLYKSRPAAAGAVARYGRPGCLAFTSVAALPGRVTVLGTEHDVFEHSFTADVRTPGGRIVGRRTVTAAGGRWSARIPYRVRRTQTGIVEAVDLSAKDGALSCLVQAPVTLRP
ncbi:MAG TPA: Gmad2 immunoglobulin-like domain-containing protein [Baekduia sp.]|nr:Gmad2 immunoglobulin-like domain-containing protein [Baekduia sp.]